jgi:hypothetical protein
LLKSQEARPPRVSAIRRRPGAPSWVRRAGPAQGDPDDHTWTKEEGGFDRVAELISQENAVPKEDMLAAARKPLELLQVAPGPYVTQ